MLGGIILFPRTLLVISHGPQNRRFYLQEGVQSPDEKKLRHAGHVSKACGYPFSKLIVPDSHCFVVVDFLYVCLRWMSKQNGVQEIHL